MSNWQSLKSQLHTYNQQRLTAYQDAMGVAIADNPEKAAEYTAAYNEYLDGFAAHLLHAEREQQALIGQGLDPHRVKSAMTHAEQQFIRQYNHKIAGNTGAREAITALGDTMRGPGIQDNLLSIVWREGKGSESGSVEYGGIAGALVGYAASGFMEKVIGPGIMGKLARFVFALGGGFLGKFIHDKISGNSKENQSTPFNGTPYISTEKEDKSERKEEESVSHTPLSPILQDQLRQEGALVKGLRPEESNEEHLGGFSRPTVAHAGTNEDARSAPQV